MIRFKKSLYKPNEEDVKCIYHGIYSKFINITFYEEWLDLSCKPIKPKKQIKLFGKIKKLESHIWRNDLTRWEKKYKLFFFTWYEYSIWQRGSLNKSISIIQR